MSLIIDNYINELRQKNKVHLITNTSQFFRKHKTPFENGFVPIMVEMLDETEYKTFDVYESGNRSIIFKHKGKWIKAKGIGIPVGFTRPLMRHRDLFTYQLYNDPGMCHRNILWGFMHESEYNSELYGFRVAQKLGQRVELLGMTNFNGVKCISFKDRIEMFAKLPNIPREKLLNMFEKEKKKTKAYSIYVKVPTDVRVGELLYALIFPELIDMIDPASIKEYIEWLGSSCGKQLRDFHDVNALHGTWTDNKTKSLGLLDVHTNAYTGNYLVDEESITMCDFDLSKPVTNDNEKEIERWALVHVENPLFYAGSHTPEDAVEQGIAKKNVFREKMAEVFKKAVDKGYHKESFDLEKSLKREYLVQLIKAKNILWNLYEIPANLTGQIDYLDFVVAHKKLDKYKRIEALKKLN